MKNALLKIGELLLDMCIFVFDVVMFTILGIMAGGFIILIFAGALPISAIYYAIKDRDTLHNSYRDQLEIVFDAFKDVIEDYF